jgi:Tol biopolymer transport system component
VNSSHPILGFGAWLLVLALSSHAAVPPVELVSGAVRRSVTAAGDSFAPLVSGDGLWVAFQSGGVNLAAHDVNEGLSDVFVYEVATGQTQLVSVNTNGVSGNGWSEVAGISRDGRHVLFISEASDLVAGDGNEAIDVFLRDRVTGVTRLVSTTPGGRSGSGDSVLPVMTPDGRYVAFESEAPDLVDGDTNGFSDIFVRDLIAGTTTRISAPSLEPSIRTRASGHSTLASLSDDGQTVLFRSEALNLAPSIPAGEQFVTNDLYVHRFPATTNRMVDVFGLVPSATPRVTVGTVSFVLSGDGRFVALLLRSIQTNQVPSGIYHVDLDTGVYERVTEGMVGVLDQDSSELLAPALGGDGQTVFFEISEPNESIAPAPNEPVVHAWNAVSRQRELVSSGGWVTNAAGNLQESRRGEFLGASRDGNFVAFLGGSTNDPPEQAARQIVVRNRTTGEARRVSRTLAGGPVDDLSYPLVSFSDDGHRLAFQVVSSRMVEDDLNTAWDILIYDWDRDAFQLVSARAPELPSSTPFGDVYLGPGSLSANGRYLAFTSTAQGLAPGQVAGNRDVFRLDRQTGLKALVSVNVEGTGAGNLSSDAPGLSADGRWVVFASAAGNLVVGDTNRSDDIFLRDVEAGTTMLVSRRRGDGLAAGGCSSPVISPDGRWVAFVSSSSELSSTDSNNQPDVFLFDRSGDPAVSLVSKSTTSLTSAGGASGQPVFSPDSRWLVFESRAPDLVAPAPGPGTGRSVYARSLENPQVLRRIATPGLSSRGRFPGPTPTAVFSPEGRFAAVLLSTGVASETHMLLHDLEEGTTTNLLGPVTGLAVSQGASRIVYRTTGTSTNGALQVRMLDRANGRDTLVSAAPDGAVGNGPCDSPLISPDGRWVVFASGASNLVPEDDNGWTDIFVKDVETGTMLRLGGNSLSSSPVLSPDGRTMVFRSFASDLTAGDYNGRGDLFSIALPGPESGFRITTITRLSTGDLRLLWVARAGKVYRIESAPDPTGPWSVLDVPVTVDAGQATAQVAGPAAASAKFFRLEER